VGANLRRAQRENNSFISDASAVAGMQCALLH
jgi:hypothetical protein